MNVLLLGISDSVFTRDFCLHVLGKKDINTVILTPALAKQYSQDYRNNHVKEIRWPDFFQKGIRRQFGVWPLIIKKWRDLGNEIGFGNSYDVMHVHYVEPLHLIYFYYFWKKARKRVLTFWGSDFFSASKVKLLLYPYFLRRATSIVFMIRKQCDYFQSVFGHKYDDKIHIIDFGNSLLNVIDDVNQRYTVEECKEHFALPVNKVIVHVGYNASRGQQHIEILRNMAILPKDIIDKMKLVFHVSYGLCNNFEAYKQQLIEIMDIVKLDYIFIDSYLQGEELAMFRKTCDLFIYGQRTDARSASPLEYIYAGAKFVCPAWLVDNYKLLDQSGIKYYVYEEFSKLPEAIQLCMNTMDLPSEQISEQGRKGIHDEISWDSLAPKWRKLYE